MLRPQPRSYGSSTARSPLIRPTDDDHPLLHAPTRPEQSSREERTVRRATEHNRRVESPNALDSDIEVYVHRVSRSDTLPRVVLQYRIPVAVLRRANRMYASDPIHFRDTLLLPVSACAIQPQALHQPDLCLVDTVTGSTSVATTAVPSRTSSPVDLRERNHPSTYGTNGRTPSPTRYGKVVKASKKDKAVVGLDITRQVVVDGVGMVDVARVPAATLSYFPPSKHKSNGYSDLARTSMDAYQDNADERPERSSFEAIRIGAGKVAADAYNGAQGLVRRLKERKNADEIDLIEL